MKQTTAGVRNSLLAALLLLAASVTRAQSILSRPVTLEVNKQQLSSVLEILSNKANFYFSYNSNIIKGDSLVTLTVYNKTVRQVLNLLFKEGYEFKESGNYIIIRKESIKIPVVTSSTASDEKYYTVTGYIRDDQTGETIGNASIYEKAQLASAISDNKGYFKLKLKSRYDKAAITVSREFYNDTTFMIEPRQNQQLSLPIMPLGFSGTNIAIAPYGMVPPDSIVIAVRMADSTHWLYTYRKTDSSMVEKTAMGKWLLSTWQRVQTINLNKFFVTRPYQLSLLPGLSTNGKMNSQVVNNVSINVWGGYSAGVNGVELAGWFNINKKSVRYFQAAGWFNIVGGNILGAQAAGISNTVFDSVRGVQAAGIGNFVKHSVNGVQMAGIYNHAGRGLNGAQIAGIGNFTNKDFIGAQISGIYNHTGATFNGAQIAGIGNFTNNNTIGAQISGLINVSRREIRGAQVASLINYAKKLSGVQIGLLNIADSSDGYSIGLINIVLKGYHKLSFYTTETLPLNAAFKTGSSKLYSILLGGVEAHKDAKIYSFGYGLGREFNFNKRLGLNAEVTSQYLYLGSWDYCNLLNRASVQLNVKLGKYFSIFAGPTYNIYYSNQTAAIPGYRFEVPYASASTTKISDRVTGWFGWNIGVNLF